MTPERKPFYRYPDEGKLGGVCAGIAHYFGWEVWLVRVVVLSGVLLSGSFFLVGYVALWFILEKAPPENNHRIEKPLEVKQTVWQAGEPPRQALHDLDLQFQRLEKRLRGLETFVTSPAFQLDREINKL
ncbi:envelope stress response membrane protein PspC [Gallaecimonas sp. GXIMD4217]|uniref:envelope stress response membrane protein PspC n=1 Tax=Gallaecimonas sp. GXIMD4217 TaxID=3131927 RepID=UPI00311B16A0